MRVQLWLRVAVFVFITLNGLNAANYFVSPAGNDRNAGSVTSPWKNISYAVFNSTAGDTIYLRGGVYGEGEIWIRYGAGGTEGHLKTIKAYANEEPILDGPRRLIIDDDYLRIEGLTFVMPYIANVVGWSGKGNGIQIINCKFTGPQPTFGAIEFCGKNGLIEGNTILLTQGVDANTRDHGIYLHYGSNNVIRGNRIEGSTGYGIHVYDEGKSDAPSGFEVITENVIIEQNFVSSSRLRSGIVIGNAYGAETRNITIRNNVFVDNAEFGIWLTGENTRDVNVYNNTVYGNGDAGIAFRSDMRNVSIKNNIIANNAGRHINNSQGAMNVLVDCNLYFPSPMNIVGVTDSQPVFGDPLFAAAGLGDFHLTSKSPAIDAGIDVGLPFVGTAPDLGAFEFSSGPSEVKKNDDPTRMTTFNLRQNYPNPFNPTTSMQIEVPVVARIKLSIYDIQGKLVRAVANGSFQPGLYKIPWNGQDDLGRDMPSGIYFCVLYAKDQNGRLLVEQTQRMILLR